MLMLSEATEKAPLSVLISLLWYSFRLFTRCKRPNSVPRASLSHPTETFSVASSALLKKTSAVAWCLVLLLMAGTFVLPTAQAVTQLNGFNLEDDEQGVVRIRLNAEHPVQVEEQRQQGVYKLILKNTTISNKMKQEGLPVVMDAQGKYIARATQLSNNQVSITIPNGVELHHQVQVVGGAANITAPAEVVDPALLPAEGADSPYFSQPIRVKKTVYHGGFKKWKQASHHQSASASPVHHKLMPQGVATGYHHHTLVAHPPTKLLPEAPPETQTLSSVSEPIAVEKPAVMEPVAENTTLLATATSAEQPPLFAEQQPEIAFPSILKESQTPPKEAVLPTQFLFDGQWLNNRFLPENTPAFPDESEPFPLLPLASVAVSSALAVGLGLWAKQQGLMGKLSHWLKFSQKETPLGVSFERVNAAQPVAVSTASDKVVHALFTTSLKQQLASVPSATLPPSPSVINAISEAEVASQFERSLPKGVIAMPLVASNPPPANKVVTTIQPVVKPQALPKPTTPFGWQNGQVASQQVLGSALQATLVQAIKQSEVSPIQVQRPSPALLSAPSTKADFKTVTQRFSNKKFQGVY